MDGLRGNEKYRMASSIEYNLRCELKLMAES
jgi:hypothetical protein